MPFDLRTLEIFLAVCDAGSMAGAAKMLQITQPAVSRTIAELEAALGCKLFDRELRPIALTPSGLLARQHATYLLIEARQILAAFQRSRQEKLPLLRIGMVGSLVKTLGPALALATRDMAERIAIRSGLTSSLASEFFARELDVVIGIDEFDHSEGVERIPLFVEPYVVIVPIEYPRSNLATIEHLGANLPLIRFSCRSRTGTDVDRQLRRLRIQAPRTIEIDAPEGLTELVASGAGWAITTPLCLSATNVDRARIRIAAFPGPAFSRTLTLWSRDRELGQAPSTIAAMVKRHIREDLVPHLLKDAPWLRRHLVLGNAARDSS